MDNKQILYIEDNLHNRRIVGKVLSTRGFTILEAESGDDGFKKIQQLIPPVVLLDLYLPGMTGFEIIERVKATPELAHISIIVLTSSPTRSDRERCLQAGCTVYMTRPFKATELIKVMDQLYPVSERKNVRIVKASKNNTSKAKAQKAKPQTAPKNKSVAKKTERKPAPKSTPALLQQLRKRQPRTIPAMLMDLDTEKHPVATPPNIIAKHLRRANNKQRKLQIKPTITKSISRRRRRQAFGEHIKRNLDLALFDPPLPNNNAS